MISNLYLIQGVFFQPQSGLGIGYKPGEGVVAVIQRAECYFLFSGILERDPENTLGEFRGSLQDRFGESRITKGVILDDEFRFTKQYTHRKDAVRYRFRKRSDGLWLGSYGGEVTGAGPSRCVLTPISAGFFDIPDPKTVAWVSPLPEV